jgi:hypothetical protein
MYKLKSKEVILDENFLEEFEAKEVNGEKNQMVDLIREWWYNPPSFKINFDKMHTIQHLKKPQMLASIMLCRLYGENDSHKFKLVQVPLLHQVHKGKIFN